MTVTGLLRTRTRSAMLTRTLRSLVCPLVKVTILLTTSSSCFYVLHPLHLYLVTLSSCIYSLLDDKPSTTLFVVIIFLSLSMDFWRLWSTSKSTTQWHSSVVCSSYQSCCWCIVTIQVRVQSPIPKSTDPTSYIEDWVILDKVPDVQLCSNFYSRL